MYTKTTEGQILYIRHGQTDYNKEVETKARHLKEVQTDATYVDCSLSDHGIEQAEYLAKKLKCLRIRNVFCSPLMRCLETALIALKDHPDRANLKIIVSPLISEVIHGIQDLPKSLSGKKEKIKNFCLGIQVDWSLVDELEEPCYFLDYIEDQSQVAETVAIIKNNPDDYQLFAKLLAQFIYRHKRPESLAHLYQRAQKFKKFLKDFLSESSDSTDEEMADSTQSQSVTSTNSEKTIVFTHSAFIRMSTAVVGKDTDLNCYPTGCYRSENCEMISINDII